MVNWDSYLEPPDYGEGEKEMTRTVFCKNEECDEFEVEVEADLNVGWSGTGGGGAYGVGYFKCEKCGQESEHGFDLDAEDFGYDPDAAYERMRDDY